MKLIYEVAISGIHNGITENTHEVFEKYEDADEYFSKLVKDTRKMYDDSYKVPYYYYSEHTAEEYIVTNVLAMSEFASKEEYPEHCDAITIERITLH